MVGRVLRVAGLATMLALLSTGTAMADAGGQGTVSVTQQFRNVPFFTMPVTNPCTGASDILTATAATEVFHITYFTTGPEFWVTGTAQGTATFTPVDPNGLSYTGHFATWFGESSNNKNDVQHNTGTFQLSSGNGSRVAVHMASHLSTNASGAITVNFSNFTFSCG